MTQLRLIVGNSRNFGNRFNEAKKRPAKCETLRLRSSTSPSISEKFLELQRNQPGAAAVIERLIDRALNRRTG